MSRKPQSKMRTPARRVDGSLLSEWRRKAVDTQREPFMRGVPQSFDGRQGDRIRGRMEDGSIGISFNTARTTRGRVREGSRQHGETAGMRSAVARG